MANLTEHQCKGKCPEFKKEQCNHCLIAQVEKREFDLGLAPDDAYVKCGISQTIGCTGIPSNKAELQFKVDDVVVVSSPKFNDDLLTITLILDKPHLVHPCAFVIRPDGSTDLFGFTILRLATFTELKAKKRLDHPVALFVSGLADVETYHCRAVVAQGKVL